MKEFAGKLAFITGGASGIGLGQAKRLTERGCRVVIADYSQEHLDSAMEYFRGKDVQVHPIRLDVTDSRRRPTRRSASSERHRICCS